MKCEKCGKEVKQLVNGLCNYCYKEHDTKVKDKKCKECGEWVERLFNGKCIRCMQNHAKERYLQEETEDILNGLDKQPGETTYDVCRKLSDIPVANK